MAIGYRREQAKAGEEAKELEPICEARPLRGLEGCHQRAHPAGRGALEVHGECLGGIVPLGCIDQPRDVGELAVYLASDDAEWVTGKIFRIDGGQQ
jgi:NAD(P)-dependent dehydrogenase (short-subunit alcohol dehydrogenase family)